MNSPEECVYMCVFEREWGEIEIETETNRERDRACSNITTNYATTTYYVTTCRSDISKISSFDRWNMLSSYLFFFSNMSLSY